MYLSRTFTEFSDRRRSRKQARLTDVSRFPRTAAGAEAELHNYAVSNLRNSDTPPGGGERYCSHGPKPPVQRGTQEMFFLRVFWETTPRVSLQLYLLFKCLKGVLVVQSWF